jgi:hypothetical protein
MTDAIVHPDPRFPDRPNHPDFWLLSEIAIEHDNLARELDLAGLFDGVCDLKSLEYLCWQRSAMVVRKLLGVHLPADGVHRIHIALSAAMLDAFYQGFEFARRKT